MMFFFKNISLSLNGKLMLILLLAIVLRVVPNVYLEIKQPGYHAENINEIEFYYDDVARSVIAGKGFVHSINPRSDESPYNFNPGTPFHFVPPLYAWWVSLIYMIFGPNVFIAKLFQCFLDASVCFLLFKIVKVINGGNVVALLSSFLYATYPLAIRMSQTLYYQVPMNIILCWMLLCYLGTINSKNGISTGIATAFSSLAKPVTLPLICIIPIIRLIERHKKADLKVSFLWILGFLAACIIVLSPWTIRNYVVFHRFIPIQDGAGPPLLQGSKEEYIDTDVISLRKKYGQNFGVGSENFTREAIENHLKHLKRNPIDYLRFLGKKFLLSWYNTEGKSKNLYVLLIQLPYLCLAILGLISYFTSWRRRPMWYIPAIIIYFCLVQVAIFPLVRYTLAVMPLLVIISAFGLNWIIKKVFFRNKIEN